MLEHGGRLRLAARQYGIPLTQWLDLSTGINPNGWPVPAIPAECWQRLPEADDGLIEAAKHYYRQPSLLAVAGSQAAIQALPLLRPEPGRVGVLHPAYAEHADSWLKAGHTVIQLDQDLISEQLPTLDTLIIVNPNNPGGQWFEPQLLLNWHAALARRGGWLVVDEAFVDTRPEHSLCSRNAMEGLIVLRSLGKFFGLAGVRCGFVSATPTLLSQLEEKLGPWTISYPSRYVASKALQDYAWQQQTALALRQQAQRLDDVLADHGLPAAGGSDLFRWVKTSRAADIHHGLAQQGILTRLFDTPASLRFGLPKTEADWSRLQQTLESIRPVIFGCES